MWSVLAAPPLKWTNQQTINIKYYYCILLTNVIQKLQLKYILIYYQRATLDVKQTILRTLRNIASKFFEEVLTTNPRYSSWRTLWFCLWVDLNTLVRDIYIKTYSWLYARTSPRDWWLATTPAFNFRIAECSFLLLVRYVGDECLRSCRSFFILLIREWSAKHWKCNCTAKRL